MSETESAAVPRPAGRVRRLAWGQLLVGLAAPWTFAYVIFLAVGDAALPLLALATAVWCLLAGVTRRFIALGAYLVSLVVVPMIWLAVHPVHVFVMVN